MFCTKYHTHGLIKNYALVRYNDKTMQFVQWSREQTVRQIAGSIVAALHQGQSTLWLVSGGSNISLQADIMAAIRLEAASRLHHLRILPIDERYGAKGHADSNYEAMRLAGFEPGDADWRDVLEDNLDFAATTEKYNDLVGTMLADAEVVFATIGMGIDGHIAGILPMSLAVDSNELVAGYTANYQRMTLTYPALRHISVTYLIAFGDKKQPIVQQLKDSKALVDLQEFPATMLYELENCTVIGGEE